MPALSSDISLKVKQRGCGIRYYGKKVRDVFIVCITRCAQSPLTVFSISGLLQGLVSWRSTVPSLAFLNIVGPFPHYVHSYSLADAIFHAGHLMA